jgi:hypothetical protein
MPITNVRGRQLRDDDVMRADLNTSVVGSAVIRRIIQGAGLAFSSTGVDTGTGDVTIGLPASGVTAGSYGSSSLVPVVTVDTYGRITSITTSTISGGGGGGSSVRCEQSLTATANQTLFSGLTCTLTSGYFDVFINGVKVNSASFSNTTNSITFVDGLAAGDIVDVVNYGIFTTSVTTANGFTGSVANATTTPAITLSTSVNGIIKGSGGSLVAAVAGTDFQAPLGFTAENSANKGAVNGYASLDAGGKVPSTQLPSYVDDVLEFANLAGFPGTGETGKIYVTIDTNKTYRWTGSVYVEISASPGSTDAVTEGSTNLYFTNARARTSISLTVTGSSGASSYNNSTGVLNVPTYTLAGLGGEPTITAGTTAQYYRGDKTFQTLNTTAVAEGTNLYYTDTRARAAISMSNNGTFGGATYNNATGVINVPNYTLAGLGGQPLATNLTSLSGLSYASTSFVKMTAAGTFALDTNTYYLASNPSGYTSNVGTVTSVAALTIGTTGTDVTSTVASGTTAPVITLNIPDASASARGLVTTGAQTIAGNKTFSSLMKFPFLATNRIAFIDVNNNLNTISLFAYDIVLNSNVTLTLGSGTDIDAQFKFNYGVSKGADFTGQRIGVDQMSFGFNNNANFDGTANTNGGRGLYFYDRVDSVYMGSFSSTAFYVGPTSTNYGLKVLRPNASVAGVTIKATGQVQFNTYTTTTSFTGTAVGYLAFTSTGDLITVAPTSGTVTSVSVTTANGVSGSVATSTTTPAITITLGAITPTSVNSVVISGSTTPTLAVTGTSSISGSNTGDNAVNSLYSGLVSNVTHTGDATGSTALTVVRLRGVDLPALGANAGFLRYTGTGTNTWTFDSSTYLTAAITSLGGLTAATQTFANDTNVTITSATSTHTLGWTGQLSVARGGTGAATLTGVLIGNGVTSFTGVEGTTSQLFRRNGGNTGYEFFTHTFASTTGATYTGQIISTLANSTTTGGAQVYLNGTTGNRIDFNLNGTADPAFTTRSVGTKIVLRPTLSGTALDYAIGIGGLGLSMWVSLPTATATHSFKVLAGSTSSSVFSILGSGQTYALNFEAENNHATVAFKAKFGATIEAYNGDDTAYVAASVTGGTGAAIYQWYHSPSTRNAIWSWSANTADRTYTLPNATGIIPISVNGQIADAAGNITISTGSGGGYTVTSQTANYTETATTGTKVIKCNTTSGAFTVTLPTAVGNQATLIIKKTAAANALTIDGAGSETIDGGLTATLNKLDESITIVSDNTNWLII